MHPVAMAGILLSLDCLFLAVGLGIYNLWKMRSNLNSNVDQETRYLG
jgi:hypothetical protein